MEHKQLNFANLKQVIINVDDFGRSHAVNRAVLDCYRVGSVSSATMLVNRPASSEAAAIAKKCPELGVGLHFNLTLGHPVSEISQVPSLLGPDGVFWNSRSLKKHWLCGGLHKDHISRELDAQFEKLISLGVSPTHIDGHDHIHMVPLVFNTIAEFCIRRNLPIRIPWINTSALKLLRTKQIYQFVKKVVLQKTLKRWQPKIRTNHSFISIVELGKTPEVVDLNDYCQLLRAVKDNPVELMVHPASIDTNTSRLNDLNRLNKAEFDILSNKTFEEMLQAEGVALTTFSST